MTSETGKQIITINMLPNISRSKGSQAVKFSEFIEYNIFFFKNHDKNEAKRLISYLFLFFCLRRALYEVKAGSQQLLIYFDILLICFNIF